MSAADRWNPTGDAEVSTSRLAKLFLDNGSEADPELAAKRLARTPVQLLIGADAVGSETMQATALSITAAAVRAFPAGVNLVLAEDQRVLTQLGGPSLVTRLSELGAYPAALQTELPTIVLGEPEVEAPERALRAIPRGWAGGVAPVYSTAPPAVPGILGAIIAAALSVSELFHAVHDLAPLAAERQVGFSVWKPGLDWREAGAVGPALELLPQKVWLLGLGHLGQASAWLISLLPWAAPKQTTVFLQDHDRLATENYVTSLLSRPTDTGQMKTRRVAAVLEELGIATRLIERRFDAHQRHQPTYPLEPDCALAGFDTPLARRPLDGAGFPHLIDAGIGAGANSFTQFVVHRLGGTRSSEEIFAAAATDRANRLLENVPYYKERARLDGNTCGALQIAGEAVGTAFVGLATAAVSMAELLRPLHAGPALDVISGNLRDPGALDSAIRELDPKRFAQPAPARALADE